jgi:Ca2+-binding RTX toxin-like protein
MGMDTLNGGAGNDMLTGGGDADYFIKGLASGLDTILDFDPLADMVDLIPYGFADATDALTNAAQVGFDVVFTFSSTNKLTLVGVDIGDLNDTNLITN